MLELLPLAIGIGLGVSLLFSEAYGVAAGGMVVPGYLALYLDRPLDVVLTLATGFATFAIVQALSSFVVIYGRRRTALMIVIGFLLGALVRWSAGGWLEPYAPGMNVIGYIIPGLIAIWLARQGVVITVSSALTAAVVVRLALLLFVGEELAP